MSEKPACNCPVRYGAHDYDCPVHWFERHQHLSQQLEQAQARAAELVDALSYLREPWDLGQMLGSETRRRVEFADSALAGNKTDAWLLRKQAEAVEYCWMIADEASSLEWLLISLADHQLYLTKAAAELEAGGEHAGSE